MVPRWLSVAALYALQKSMIATPWGPRAVPTGGAGVAAPAGIWILTIARTFFLAMRPPPLLRSKQRTSVVARPVAAPPRVQDYSLATLENSSSTGVSRPKMLTRTL